MKNVFIIAFLLLSASVFSQLRFVETFAHYEAGTSIVSYQIDNQLVKSGQTYGIKVKTPTVFTSFAIAWEAMSSKHAAGIFDIEYRVHKPGKGWTIWKSDEGFTNPGDTRHNMYQSNLLFGLDEGVHDSIEFIISAPQNENIVKAYLILQDNSNEIKPKSLVISEDKSTKSCPEFPTVIPRSAWCGSYDACHNPTYSPTYRNATHTVVHHGASPDSYTDGYAVVRSYWNYHVNYNGWSDIGYNYLFDKYGNFFQGRHNPNMPNQDVHAAHAGYANPYSIGINFLGNSDAANTAPTTAQMQKCSEFLAWWYDYKILDPLSSASILNQAGTQWITLPRICGHKDVNPGGTTCPGNALYALLPSMRTQTNQILVDCTTPSDTEPPTTSITTDRNWYNSDFQVSFSDADNPGGTGVKYSFYQLMDFNGTEWRANSSKGFFNDNFTSEIHPEWTPLWGTWSVEAEHLLQTNETSTNTNIYASLTQGTGNIYLYHWKQRISGSGSNKRSGMHFFCSDPTGTGRLQSYMVYLRVDGNTGEIYKYMNNSYSTAEGGFYTSGAYTIDANVWYDVKVILNTNTGLISLFIDDNHVVSITDPSPLTSGNSISPRTGGCRTEYDDIKVYKTRENTIIVNAELNSSADIRYQSPSANEEAGRIRTILVDNANNWSESYAKNIFIDYDAPSTGISVEGEWQTADFTANFADTDDLSGIEKRFYNVADYNGVRWTSNQNRGYAYNDFDSEYGTEWTSQVGNWSVNAGKLVQTNEAEGNTNLWSYLQQDLSNRYMYEFDMKIDGSNSNKRAGFHFFSDDPTQTNRGNGYFVWFRLSSQDLEFYKVTNNVFSLEKYYSINISAGEWYNIKTIFDRITGECYVYMDDVLVGEYLDSEPYQTGNYVSFRSGNSLFSVDNFRVYRTRYSDLTVSLGSSANDIRYQNQNPASAAAKILSFVSDTAKNISAIETKLLNIDWTAPTNIATVNDGINEDIDITYNHNTISGNWTESSDSHSGVIAYYYAVGTSVGGTQLIDWTNIGLSTSFTNNTINLVVGTTYYISIKAQNGAGLFSNIKTSDGVQALNPPVVPDCPEDLVVCVSDASFALTGADPTGGIYSGLGVSSGTFNPTIAGVGMHEITYTLSSETCQFNITVNSLPAVTCQEDIYIAVGDAPITLNESSPAGGTYTINGLVVTSFDPALYAVGDYQVLYTYISSPENCSNTCSFNIFVFEPLVLNCPENKNICITDNAFTLSGATPPGGTYSGNGVSAGVFNPALVSVGNHTITYSYDTETCEFDIQVYDLPVLSCPDNIEISIEESAIVLSNASPTGGVYSLGGNEITEFDPQTYGEGLYTIYYSYTGLGNCVNTCSFEIEVFEPVVLSCPEDFDVCVTQNSFDLVGASPTGGTYSGAGVSAGVFNPQLANIGTHIITYTYESQTCQYHINVIDEENLTCPQNLNISVEASAFPLSGAMPEGGEYRINGNPASIFNPQIFGVGEHTITYTYFDFCQTSCEYTITVFEPVNIICPSGFDVCIDNGSVELSGASPEGGSYSGNGVSGNIFNPETAGVGNHTIAYTYENQSCNFIISVNPLPAITCPSNITTSINDNEFPLSGGEPEGGLFEYDGNIITMFNPTEFGAGVYTLSYNYQNQITYCNSSCEFTISVVEELSVTCPDDIAVCANENDFELTGANPNGGSYSGSGIAANTFSPVIAGPGNHTISYTYNSETCNFVITVNPLPQLTCPQNIYLTTDDNVYILTGASPAGGWYEIGGNTSTEFDPAQYEVGQYSVIYNYVSQPDNCLAECEFTIYLDEYVNISDALALQFIIYPNPNSGNFVIETNNINSDVLVEITNIQAQVIYSGQIEANTLRTEMSLTNLSKGVYFVRLKNNDVLSVKKLVIRN